jgi:hypothetical protein
LSSLSSPKIKSPAKKRGFLTQLTSVLSGVLQSVAEHNKFSTAKFFEILTAMFW